MSKFSTCLREARTQHGYSIRKLAQLVGIDYTYLSKLENDRQLYPPKESVLRTIAHHLELDGTTLCYLAGRITTEDQHLIQELAKTYGKNLKLLLRVMRDRPEIVQEILSKD